MRTLRAVAFASILAIGAAAHAADLVVASAPVEVYSVPLDWSGFYIGGNIGGAWGTGDSTNNSVTTNGLLTTGIEGVNAGTYPGPDRSLDFDGGLTGGVQAGYNFQVDGGGLVLGLEGDLQWLGLEAPDSFDASAEGPTYTSTTTAEWFGTARARVGYSFDNFLPYVTGGLAFVENSVDLTVSPWTTTGGDAPSPLDPQYFASASSTSTGYAIGAGFEYALDGNWSLKAEYLHLGFDAESLEFDFDDAGTVNSDLGGSFDVVRVGANYRF